MSQKAELEITIKGNQAVQEANKIKRGITDIGTKGQTTASQIDRSTTKMSTSLSKISTTSRQASTSITELGTKSQVASGIVDSAAGKMSQSLSRIGVAGKTAGATTTISMTKAASGISLVSGAAVNAQANITRMGTTAQAAGAQISQSMSGAAASIGGAGAAAGQAGIGFGAGALGIAALGTSAATTFTGMSNLNKAQLKVNKSQQKMAKSTVGLRRAQDLLSSTTLAITRFQSSINKMQNEGKESSGAYEIALLNLELQQQKLITAQDDLIVKTADIKIAFDDAAQAGDDLQDTYINMSVSIANTILISLFVMSTLIPATTKAWIGHGVVVLAVRAKLLLTNKAVIASIFSMQKFRLAILGTTFSMGRMAVAAGGATGGMRGLAIGIKGVFIAMGPIGFAIIGISTAFVLWETNAFGVRDALIDLWEFLKKILPVLALLESAIKSVFPEEVVEGIKDTEEAVEELTESLEVMSNVAMGAAGSAGQLSIALSGVNNEFGNTINAVLAFNRQLRGKGLEELEQSFELLIGNMIFANEQMDEFPERMNLALAEISPALNSIADQWDTAWGAGAFRKRINQMLEFGDITQKEFDQITKAIEKTGNAADSVTDKLDILKKKQSDLRQIEKLNVPTGFIAGLKAAGFGADITGLFREQGARGTTKTFESTVFAIGTSGEIRAKTAIFKIITDRFGTRRILTSRGQGSSGGLGRFEGARIAAEDQDRNRLKTGGVRDPITGLVVGGFTSVSRFRNFRRAEVVRLAFNNKIEAAFFGFKPKFVGGPGAGNFIKSVKALLLEAGISFPSIKLAQTDPFGAGATLLAQAIAIVEQRRLRRVELGLQLGLTAAQIKSLESTAIGMDEIDGRLDFIQRNKVMTVGVV